MHGHFYRVSFRKCYCSLGSLLFLFIYFVFFCGRGLIFRPPCLFRTTLVFRQLEDDVDFVNLIILVKNLGREITQSTCCAMEYPFLKVKVNHIKQNLGGNCPPCPPASGISEVYIMLYDIDFRNFITLVRNLV